MLRLACISSWRAKSFSNFALITSFEKVFSVTARSFRMTLLSAGFALLIGLCCATPSFAQPGPRGKNASDGLSQGPRDYRSPNFLVHTDLSAEEANELLTRLETMLQLISTYWGQPNRKTIECYVVKDLANWPQGVFPPEAHAKIVEGAGLTMTQATLLNGRLANATSIVYAVSERGTPQHEAVHAYCGQNFGHTGPTWYSEGMAEMGSYWRKDNSSVEIPEVVLEYLQQSDPKPLSAIVDNTDQTGDSWENYAWRWALCHLLANNDNYAKRFRPLGLSLLQNRGGSFEQTYGAMAEEIAFEYRFFLDHLDNGLRADLTAWKWGTKFQVPRSGRPLISKIAARGGWQPSRVKVVAGQTYDVAATGQWSVSDDGELLTADATVIEATEETRPIRSTSRRTSRMANAGSSGRRPQAGSAQETNTESVEEANTEAVEDDKPTPPEGAGRLMGVILDTSSMTLGEPFEVGAQTQFTAEMEGNLYLRCADAWNQLHDNEGEMWVAIRGAN